MTRAVGVPPASNTGVTTLGPAEIETDKLRFDWYGATLSDTPGGDFVASVLASACGGKARRARGRNGYPRAFSIEVSDTEYALVLFGGSTGPEVHVAIPGAGCDVLVPALRAHWPEHRVARVDVSLDLVGVDFDGLDQRLLALVGTTVKHQLITDSEGGATRYLGSRKSDYLMRVYKKTEQLRKVYGKAARSVPEGVVRVEAEVKPGSADKSLFADLSPFQVICYRRLGRTVFGEVLGSGLPLWDGDAVHRKPSSWERLLSVLGSQYGPSVRDRAVEVGGAEVLRELGERFGLLSVDGELV